MNIVGLRGKAIGKTRTIYNDLQQHYDLGEKIKPAVVNLGGNASFKRDILIEVGGFDPKFFGHEDLELTYRLVKKYGKDKVIYYPKALIYHNFANSFKKYLQKQLRHSLMWDKLKETHPYISAFQRDYKMQAREKDRRYGLILKMKFKVIRRIGLWVSGNARILKNFQERMSVRKLL